MPSGVLNTTGPRASPLRKRLVFASPEVTITILFATVNSWYFYFLVSIVGLPPMLASAAFAFGRIVDAVLDPIVGRWSDRNSRRVGRKRVIRLALVPTALAFIALWYVPAQFDGVAYQALGAAAGFALFAVGYTLISVPRMAMLPGYEPDYHGRTGQVAVDMTFIFLTLSFTVAGVPALITLGDDALTLAGTSPDVWWLVAAALAGVACLAYVPFLIAVPDQRPASHRTVEKPLTLFAGLVTVLQFRRFRMTVIVFFLSVVSLVSIQSMLPFFLESYIAVPKSGQAPVLGMVFGCSLLTLPIWVAIGRRFDKAGGLKLGIAVYMLFLLLASLIAQGSGATVYLYITAVLAGAGITALSVFPWAMVPDAVDVCRDETGEDLQGLCTSVFTFSNKLAGTVAVLLNGTILSLSGHDENQAVQSDLTTSAIYAATVFLPLVFALLCIVALLNLCVPRQ
ncbi:MFS transporter [Roseovarius sp. MMSF_3281]|uniref:MFS transporter n=1 Tax=Roseovarius sp. MMSF_3281 TaxID=3046694 RepID=UPI00273CF571|nr:MFS transporter [Roseovarius sp. MMSF_3281]